MRPRRLTPAEQEERDREDQRIARQRIRGDRFGDWIEARTPECDMVLICNSPDKADQLLNGLEPSHAIDAERSAERIAALVPTAAAMDWDSLQNDAVYQAARKLASSIK